MTAASDAPPPSALVLLVPDAEPIVGALRLAHDPIARAGVGAHVTLLFPFVPPARIDDDLRARLATQIAALGGAVELRFDRVARFPDVAYLALADAPAAAVVAITRALAAAWPDYPPYDGKYADIVPHLTIAHGDDDVLAPIAAALAPRLPLIARVTHVSLLAADAAGPWHERARFAL